MDCLALANPYRSGDVASTVIDTALSERLNSEEFSLICLSGESVLNLPKSPLFVESFTNLLMFTKL